MLEKLLLCDNQQPRPPKFDGKAHRLSWKGVQKYIFKYTCFKYIIFGNGENFYYICIEKIHNVFHIN